MKDQPECDQPHNHEQTKPVPSFDWGGESKANSFRQFFCRIPLSPVRLISHLVTTSYSIALAVCFFGQIGIVISFRVLLLWF